MAIKDTSNLKSSALIPIQPLYATDERTEAQREAGSCARSHKKLVVLRGLDPELFTSHF